MLSSPGPLDRGLRSYFYVTPPPDDWTPEQVESYLREDNDRMLVTLVIHEAVPGHYLQLAYANRSPSFVRAAFSSGVFAEGWAVYVTQVMMDLGYAADDPALLLVHWKLYLRAVTNALIDVGIHARGMTEEEADRPDGRGRLPGAERGRQEVRAGAPHLDPARRRTSWAPSRCGTSRRSAGVGWRSPRTTHVAPPPSPPPRVVGGFGETPGFDYREHLEAVLAHGTPPLPALRRILLGDSRVCASTSGAGPSSRRPAGGYPSSGRAARTRSIARRRSSSPAGSRS